MYIKRLGKYGIKIKKNMEENYQARFQELVINGTVIKRLLTREDEIINKKHKLEKELMLKYPKPTTNEDSKMINEKEILSVEGEEQARKLSENDELKNLDIIWSSSYTRAKATAKYIAYANNLPFNLDNNLSERKLGNLKELGEFMKDKNTRDPSQEQLLDRTFRTSDGESAEQTRERMNKFFDKILKEYEGKRIAVISHGGSIKFFLLNWCTVNENVKLVYNENTILNIKSPCLLKLTFRKNELINLEQIY